MTSEIVSGIVGALIVTLLLHWSGHVSWSKRNAAGAARRHRDWFRRAYARWLVAWTKCERGILHFHMVHESANVDQTARHLGYADGEAVGRLAHDAMEDLLRAAATIGLYDMDAVQAEKVEALTQRLVDWIRLDQAPIRDMTERGAHSETLKRMQDDQASMDTIRKQITTAACSKLRTPTA